MSDKSSEVKLADLIADHVHSEDFFLGILEDIENVSKTKADTKAKLKLELMSYVMPKIKAKDEEITQGINSIEINFIEAQKPEGEGTDEEEVST